MKEIKDDKSKFSIWKNFSKYLRPYRLDFIKMIILMVGLGVLDAVFPLLNKYAIDNFVAKKTITGLKGFMAFYMGIVFLLALTVKLFINLGGKIEARLSYDIRKAGFEKLQTLPLSYYDRNPLGNVMSRMTSDINRMTEIISWGLTDIAWGLSLMLAITISMFSLNKKLALATLSVVPALLIVSLYFQRRIFKAQREVRKVNSSITAAYNEDIQGARTTKTLVREDLNLEEFGEITSSMKEKSIRAITISSIYLPIVLTLGSVGTALVISIGGVDIMRGTLGYGTLVAFISYAGQFFEPINQMAVIFSEMQIARASAERVFKLLDEDPDIKDTAEVTSKYGDLLNPKEENWPEIIGKVEFKDVSFSYKEGEKILDGFNLVVEPGEKIALVGETGSGKSTIVNLLCRFYEPTEGEILIDGRDYKSLPQNWIHENLGYMLQTPHLFSGTIADNIRYGKLDALDEEVVRASKMVNADEFIRNMKEGYDSSVGEGGNLLSTGQKQLVSFARAIIRDPRLFVLDEATSSIDTETESVIQNTIENVLENRTSFIIAHRLSTIRNADKILVIKDGRIKEMGNHEELILEKGYYYELYTNQFIKEESNLLLEI